MSTPNADCAMCANWTQDYCKQTFGRCSWQEGQAIEGVYQGGGPKPQWIEVWMSQSADASTCEGFQTTVQGQRELDIRNAEDNDRTRSGMNPQVVAQTLAITGERP